MLYKMFIDSLFSNYGNAFPGWRHYRQHFAVVFDPAGGPDWKVFCLEGLLFQDARFLLERCREGNVSILAAVDRRAADAKLGIYVRSALSSLYIFLEAYLNGLAYDCCNRRHSELTKADHDTLTEWDDSKKRPKFVNFDLKIFKYPAIVAKTMGLTIDLSRCQAAHRIANQGKAMRNALTHPSPFIDPYTGVEQKVLEILTLDLTKAEALFEAAKDYVDTVERALGYDPTKSASWLSEGYNLVL